MHIGLGLGLGETVHTSRPVRGSNLGHSAPCARMSEYRGRWRVRFAQPRRRNRYDCRQSLLKILLGPSTLFTIGSRIFKVASAQPCNGLPENVKSYPSRDLA